jgi:DNA gyrase subunit A
LQVTERNGETVAALQVSPGHELMLISSNGTLVRTPVADVSIVGRNTQGVRLIRLDEGDRLTGVERVESLGEELGVIDDMPPEVVVPVDSPPAG